MFNCARSLSFLRAHMTLATSILPDLPWQRAVLLNQWLGVDEPQGMANCIRYDQY